MPKHKLSIYQVFIEGLLIVLSFANIYFILDKINPNSFSIPLNLVDSIYFSVITAFTIGYGDILPVNKTIKLIVILEVIIFYIYTVFAIGVFLSVFLNKNQPDSEKTNDT